MIEVAGVTKRYAHRLILRGVNLCLRPGEVVGIRGGNGTGKSTLLKIMAGRMQPTAGQVRWGDSQHCNDLSWLGHDPGHYLDFTARENLSFFSALPKSHQDGAIPAEQALDEMGLVDVGNKPVRAFSRGMKQRLALARLKVEGRSYWVLDEPSTGLDSASRDLMANHIRKHASKGGSVLVVSHLPDVLADLADRTAELKRGVLEWGEGL